MNGNGPALALGVGEEMHFMPSPASTIALAAIRTPATSCRKDARRLCRETLRRMLAARLACAPAAIALIGEPGQPPRLAGHPEVAIAISHESGLSLVAAGFGCALGIDLLKLENLPAGGELAKLSADYLGPATTAKIMALPNAERGLAFAQAWTVHEARLKCRGMGLDEWNATLGEHLAEAEARRLALPAGYVGTLAVLAKDGRGRTAAG